MTAALTAAATPLLEATPAGTLAVSLGPLALPVAPLLLLGAVLVAQQLASCLARRAQAGDTPASDASAESGGHMNDAIDRATPGGQQGAAGRGEAAGAAITGAALLGLLAARMGWLALHAEAYLKWPLAALDLRDGGWHVGAGFATGMAWLAWRGLHHPALRQALAAGAALGGLLWWAAGAALGTGIGAPMPAVALVDLDSGDKRRLAQLADGRPAVVVLWASWCGPCREEMPLLAAAQRREAGMRFVFVNQGEDEATVRRYLASLPYPVHGVMLDAGWALGPAVGSPGLPTTLFYDAAGRLAHGHFGVLSAAALDIRLSALHRSTPAPR